VIVLETVISWKFRHGTGHLTNEPTPLYISIPWIVTCVTLVGYYLYLRLKPNRVTKYGDAPWEIEAKKAQASGAITSKAEKKKEKAAAVTAEAKQKVEQVVQKVEATAQQARNENHEEKSRAAAKNTKKVETAEPEVTEARKRWNKKKAGEEVESPEPKIEAPAQVQVQVPEEDEWRTIPSNRAIRKSKKSKRD